MWIVFFVVGVIACAIAVIGFMIFAGIGMSIASFGLYAVGFVIILICLVVAAVARRYRLKQEPPLAKAEVLPFKKN